MSTSPSSQLTAASGGHDWLFADPFAYQYSQLPDHVRDLEARSSSSTTGSVVCELEGSSPSPVKQSATSGARTELNSDTPTASPLRPCATSPPTPIMPSVAELGSENYAQSPTGHQKNPHVANYVKHSEISRGRYANVRLSGRHHLGHHRTASESVIQSGAKKLVLDTRDVPAPLIPGPHPTAQKIPQIHKLLPVKTDVQPEHRAMRVEEVSSSTSKKDFDAILKDIAPPKKKTSWRQSLALNHR